ncbi:MAG: hypothetical protein ACO1NM_07825 [Sphingobium phenoxybenzoativorans]
MTQPTISAPPRNYGDPRIVEIDDQIVELEAQILRDQCRPDHSLARVLRHYRNKAARFREQHSRDPYWVACEEV